MNIESFVLKICFLHHLFKQSFTISDEEEEITRPYECMDVSYNGRVLCAGSQLVEDDAYLVFWDMRMSKPLGGYWNSHTDDITQVCTYELLHL